MEKLIEKENLDNIIKKLKSENKKIVFTNGCFDILHAGHVRYLKESKKFGDILIVGLNSDVSVKKIKGESRPINPEMDRAEVLAGLEAVSYIVLFDETSPAGKRASAPPRSRCSLAILSPFTLLLNPFLSVNGFTGKNDSSRFGIYERRKLVRILISGLTFPIMLNIMIPSIAP